MTPETRKVLDLAQDWRTERAAQAFQGAIQPASNLLYCWIGLNALYSMAFPWADGDWDQLKRFASWPIVQSLHGTLFESNPGYRTSTQYSAQALPTSYRAGRSKGTLPANDPTVALGVLEKVYQVRNNLFHGRKSPSDPYDGRVLKWAGAIVGKLVAALLDSHGMWDNLPPEPPPPVKRSRKRKTK